MTAASRLFAAEQADRPAVRVGLMTDLHFADKPPAGTRYYRQTMTKIEEAIDRINTDRCDCVIELGDLIDSASTLKQEIGNLKRIEAAYAAVKCPRYYVLGNHCVHTLRKQEFFEYSAATAGHYSFDTGVVHFVVLDACFNSKMQPYERGNFVWDDSNIPPAELEWLEADLAAARGGVIVFVHQRLDVGGHYGVKNAPAVRAILEHSNKVLAVFQGHNHVNDLRQIHHIHYCTLAAMIEGSGAENNAYGVLEVFKDGSLRVRGYRQQANYRV